MDISVSKIPQVKANILSKGDIDNLYNYCISLEDEQIDIEVKTIYNAEEFVRAGFIPYKFNIDAIVEYIMGMNLDEISFWYSSYIADEIKNLNKVIYWVFKKISRYVRDGLNLAESHGLILYAPDRLYKSMRPITNMSMFRGPGSRTISKEKIVDNSVSLDGKVWNVIPVTRYAAGMSRGLYYGDESNDGFCGTFYYKEDESTTLLAYRTSRTFFNKTHAMIELDPGWSSEDFLLATPDILKHMNGKLPKDLRLTPQEYYKLYPKQVSSDFVKSLPQLKYYAGKKLGLYAEEDNFDQNICNLASNKGIDILILTHMVGSHQIVTEVLDTRSRDNSFKSLIYVIG